MTDDNGTVLDPPADRPIDGAVLIDGKDVIDAAAAMLAKTVGVKTVDIHSGQFAPEGGLVTAWVAIASRPCPEEEGGFDYEVSAALDPVDAVLRLATVMTDGGTCVECGRPVGVDDDIFNEQGEGDEALELLSSRVCWIRYDAEAKRFKQQHQDR